MRVSRDLHTKTLLDRALPNYRAALSNCVRRYQTCAYVVSFAHQQLLGHCMPQDTAMTLRLNRETTTKLRDSARSNHRSLASEIRFALDRYLADTTAVSKPAAPAVKDYDVPDFDE